MFSHGNLEDDFKQIGRKFVIFDLILYCKIVKEDSYFTEYTIGVKTMKTVCRNIVGSELSLFLLLLENPCTNIHPSVNTSDRLKYDYNIFLTSSTGSLENFL